MKKTGLLGLILLSTSASAPAHHSFAAEYSSRPITLNGTITRFDWINPHTRIYLNVTDASGAVTKWECEGSAPGGLVSNGWNKDSLKPGDRVTIEGFPAKDHSNVCKASAVKLANGRRLLMGSIGRPVDVGVPLPERYAANHSPALGYLDGSANFAGSIATFGWYALIV